LRELGCAFEVAAPAGKEDPFGGGSPREHAERAALEKALSVDAGSDYLILAADTVVARDGMVFGKPADEDDARGMLRALSGRKHLVWTAVCLRDPADGWISVKSERTGVRMRELSGRDIERYVSSREGMDKAGSYAIQGEGASLVSRLEGCYSNVVGLPLGLFKRMVEEWRVHV